MEGEDSDALMPHRPDDCLDEPIAFRVDDDDLDVKTPSTRRPLRTSLCHCWVAGAADRTASIASKTRVKSFCLKYFLPIGHVASLIGIDWHGAVLSGFASALAISILCPSPGRFLSDIKMHGIGVMQALFVCVIFLLSGLSFSTSDIKGAIHAAQGIVFGVFSILILTPMSGFAIMALGFVPYPYRVGLCVFVSVPTTLTIGVALVEQAGGNAALGLLLTVISNMFGALTVPFAIQWTIGSSSDASIDAKSLLLKLVLTLLVPLVVGKMLLEISSAIQGYVSTHRSLVSLTKNGACVAIVWLSMSHSRKELISQKISDLALLIVLCSILHLSFFVFNFFCCCLIRIRDRERMAVVIMASQKTFPVCLAVIAFLDPDRVGDLGLPTIPCIIAHMTQLFMDSFILSRWKYDSDDQL